MVSRCRDSVARGSKCHVHGGIYRGYLCAVHACEGDEVRMCINDCDAPKKVLRELGAEKGCLTDIGTPISSACCSAACEATRAPLCVSVSEEAVAATVGVISRLGCPRYIQKNRKKDDSQRRLILDEQLSRSSRGLV